MHPGRFRMMQRDGDGRSGVVGVREEGRRRRPRSCSRSTNTMPPAFRLSSAMLLSIAVIIHLGNAAASSTSSGDVVVPDSARRGRGRGHLTPSTPITDSSSAVATAALAASTLLTAPTIHRTSERGVVGRRQRLSGPVPVGAGSSTRTKVDLVEPGAIRGHVSSPGHTSRLGSRVGNEHDVVARTEISSDEGESGTRSPPTHVSPASSPPSTIKVAMASYSTVILLSSLSNILSNRAAITADLLRDLGASLLCAVLGYVYVRAITELAKSGLLEPRDSRKIIHTGSAPLFMMFWPLFSDGIEARFFAGVVPLINAFRLYAAGTSGGGKKNGGTDESEGGEGRVTVDGDGGKKNGASDLAFSVSRTGDAREALGGPFIYVLILLGSTVLFWRDSMVGVMALSTMAAGDGMADIVGRRFGKTNKWPFSPDKSVAGSAAFFVSSLATSSALRAWFLRTGVLTSSSSPLAFGGDGGDHVLLRMAAVCAATALVELLPLGDDNWTVPGTAAVLAALLLG